LFSRINFGEYDLIGFSCTFSQLLPSLSFAKEIKAKYPNCKIVFGGTGVYGNTGQSLVGDFSQADCVCRGHGEEYIVRIAKGELSYDSQCGEFDLERSPLPDYDDYFDHVHEIQSKGLGDIEIYDGSIPYESSRGCFWATKHPCTFCALNENQPQYKSKSSEKIAKDIESLSEKYSPGRIVFTDNLLNVRGKKELFGVLKTKTSDTAFFAEVKPILTKDELIMIKEAGVDEVQAGIEALSTDLQKLLSKGTVLEQTLRFLEGCRDVGIDVHYNCLIGIPGETEKHYDAIIDFLPSVMSLPPPSIPLTPVSLHRNSAYWLAPEKYGISNVRPAKQYSLIYPKAFASKYAPVYDFDLELPEHFDANYINRLVDGVLEWRREYYGVTGSCHVGLTVATNN
jgi:ribosomal peptide maturation radical SAM protein 1